MSASTATFCAPAASRIVRTRISSSSPMAASAAPSPMISRRRSRRCSRSPNRPEHIIIETSGLALPKPLVKAFEWPTIRPHLTVDGVIAVVDGPAVAAGRFADDLDAIAKERAEIAHDRPRQSARGSVRGSAALRRSHRAQQDRSVERGGRGASRRADSRHGAARGEAAARQRGPARSRHSARPRRGGRGRSRHRPSHHDTEEDHDHDDFESFIVEIAAARDPAELLERLARVARSSMTCCA